VLRSCQWSWITKYNFFYVIFQGLEVILFIQMALVVRCQWSTNRRLSTVSLV